MSKRKSKHRPIIGAADIIFLSVQAYVYRDWAAHSLYLGSNGDAVAPLSGWAVTYVPTGLKFPAEFFGDLDLTEEEACAVALALHRGGIHPRDEDDLGTLADRQDHRYQLEAVCGEALASFSEAEVHP